MSNADLLAEFDAAVASITQERGGTYGHPGRGFERIASLSAHFDHVEDPAVRHALRMICVKLGRLAESPGHLDSWIDIAGYCRTAVMVLTWRKWLSDKKDHV